MFTFTEFLTDESSFRQDVKNVKVSVSKVEDSLTGPCGTD